MAPGRSPLTRIRSVLPPVVLAAVLVLAGCGGTPGPAVSGGSPAPLASGLPPVTNGGQRAWPGQGPDVRDAALRAEVTRVVGRWRVPGGGPVDPDGSGIVWLGPAGGTELAEVVLTTGEPRGDRSGSRNWLLEVTGPRGHLAVGSALEYPRGQWRTDVPLLPLRSSCCTGRYLASAAVRSVQVAGRSLPVDAGLTGPAGGSGCAARVVTATTDAGPRSVLDLGRDIGRDPATARYPLLTTDGTVPAGLDGCAAAKPGGVLASLSAALATAPGHGGQVARVTGGTPLPLSDGSRLTVLTWTVTGLSATTGLSELTSVVWSPASGAATWSAAQAPPDPYARFRAYRMPTATGLCWALSWPAAPGGTLTVPAGVTVLGRAGTAAVVRAPAAPTELLLTDGTSTEKQSIGPS